MCTYPFFPYTQEMNRSIFSDKQINRYIAALGPAAGWPMHFAGRRASKNCTSILQSWSDPKLTRPRGFTLSSEEVAQASLQGTCVTEPASPPHGSS